MNVKLFKKLIREAVIEALHEELPDIINETLAKQNKQPITENKTFSFTSADVSPLPGDVRSSLMAKMGAEFGFQQPQRNDLKVIDAVDESTGEKVWSATGRHDRPQPPQARAEASEARGGSQKASDEAHQGFCCRERSKGQGKIHNPSDRYAVHG